jgi:hypothetical protein
MVPQLLSKFSPTIVDLLELAFSPSLHDSCLQLEGKERGDLDLHLHQSISPLSEGSLLDLDLGIHLLFSLFFLPSPSIALVALVGFESEGL